LVVASVSPEETDVLRAENTNNSMNLSMAIQRGKLIIKNLFLFRINVELLKAQRLLSLSRT